MNAYIFDMDGVLFDTEMLYNKAWYASGERFNLDKPTLDIIVNGCVGLNHIDTKNYVLTHTYEDFPFDDYMKCVKEIFSEYIARQGVPVKKGVCELLNYLKASGYRTAIASSTSMKSILSHLNSTGLKDKFDAVISGDMVENGKPEPEIYQKAAAAIDYSPCDCFAFEDSYNGIYSACRAGMKTIMIPDLYPSTEEIKPMLYAEYESMVDVLEALKNNIL